MSWLDTVIIITSLALGLLGLWKGIIRTAFGIAGLVGGIYLAGRWAGTLADALFSNGSAWTEGVAYAIILITIIIAASIVGHFVAKLVHITFLGWIDRLAGFILGTAIGVTLFAALLTITTKYFPPVENVVSTSPIAKAILQYFASLLELFPGESGCVRNFFK
jgi:membrane protein required for colicin V production